MKETIFELISNYGYTALYALLAAGIVGLPIPDETLMTFVGSLTMDTGPLNFTHSLIVSYLGTMTGMLISYTVGLRLGKPFLYKIGKWVRVKQERITRTELWFQKYGMWAVFFGYFVPGLRHFTCYLAGVSGISLWRYLLFAGSGALLWCCTFLSLGHFIGANFEAVLKGFHTYLGICLMGLAVAAAVGFLIYYLVRRKRKKNS
ncbi:DedA family protein [Paenibacillus chitinolyticus]|uniref:DedA family protein n=1 Tax=Paenibacillus chitinolyticus TaxID=79263 RepID=A0A410WUH3_9BACL|nr:DedA family protein [Paenibacillus chitinolyticus]MCY9591875.1 DedA family protein [Paenibacillus chitinolyticus]MCY9595175.1 DedA family protein [Paenibacillus chitinolyticus]QAV18035.1 DedA family protein [Paenibacillus chitinolyticus]